MPTPYQLWNTDDARQQFLDALHAGDATAEAYLAISSTSFVECPKNQDTPEELHNLINTQGSLFMESCAILAIANGDRDAAALAADIFHRATEAIAQPSCLGRGRICIQLAIVIDSCWSLLDSSAQAVLCADAWVWLHSMRQVGLGNPHQVVNNWWAITHSGALCLALALYGRVPQEQDDLVEEEIEWASMRCLAFAQHFGDAGFYHEGLGYQDYAASHLMPALLALQHSGRAAPFEEFPSLKKIAEHYYLIATSCENQSDAEGDPATWGRILSWNDSGTGFRANSCQLIAMHLSPDRTRGALRSLYDTLDGMGSPNALQKLGWWGLFFGALYYPYSTPKQDPEATLTHAARDSRQGFVFFRNRYADGQDVAFGGYARTTHIGGHAHDDAGSLRLDAFGYSWIRGGGQNKLNAMWQSVALPAAGRDRRPFGCGALTYNTYNPQQQRGSVGMDLRNASGCYHERYTTIDFAGACGAPVALAILDQVDDHRAQDWCWHMTFDPRVSLEIDADQCGFVLSAPNGAKMRARFLGDKPQQIEALKTPDSERTYSNKMQKRYPGVPYLSAHFAHKPHLGIYVVMCLVQEGTAPSITAMGEGVAARIGEWEWTRPFGAAVPVAYRPGKSSGLCKVPTGIAEA